VKVMDILFQKGADPNKMDFIKKTPLNSAALVDNVEVIKYLLEHGADPDIRDDRHMTANEWACALGHDETMKLLEPVTMEKKADNGRFLRALAPTLGKEYLSKCGIGFVAYGDGDSSVQRVTRENSADAKGRMSSEFQGIETT
jgi:hypothetical protein